MFFIRWNCQVACIHIYSDHYELPLSTSKFTVYAFDLLLRTLPYIQPCPGSHGALHYSHTAGLSHPSQRLKLFLFDLESLLVILVARRDFQLFPVLNIPNFRLRFFFFLSFFFPRPR